MPPNITDAYFNVAKDFIAPLAMLPPGTPPPSSGDNTVLQLHVPAENSSLEMGAGRTPGIRMETDHHAHISALSPLTTISLGWAGGRGPLGPPGLGIVTDGDKTEVIAGTTSETYKRAATIHYAANVDEDCGATKTERVSGDRTEDTGGSRYDAVGGDWLQTCAQWKTESVIGGVTLDYKSLALTVHKDAFETYNANSTVQVAGQKTENVAGTYTQTLGGLKSTVTGSWFAHHGDAKIDLCAAIQFTGTTGVRVSMNESLDITHSLASWSNTSFDLAKTDIRSSRASVNLYNALFHIHK